MIIVRSTRENIPEIEVNVDTVYVRSNIRRIEDDDFIGWEYEETQYDKNNYIELLPKENKELKGDLQKSEQTNKINMLALIEVNNQLRQLEG